MPEAVKKGGGDGDVAVDVAENTVPPTPVDLATDGAIEVKPPPNTEPSLPADHKPKDDEEKMGETAPDVIEPPTAADTNTMSTPEAASEENKPSESDPKKELEEMIVKGRALLLIKRDCYAAAETLSKACEKSSEIYGELSENCGELYYLYGCSMLECGKSENNVLGESMKNKDSEIAGDNDDDVEEDEAPAEEENNDDADNKEGKDEAMEVDESEGVASSNAEVGTSNGAVKEDKDDSEDVTKEEEEDEADSSLKVAWEMFEMAKVAYTRLNNKEKLADTLIKLGEVGIESGHPAAMEDMIKALYVRQELFPNTRIIAETHFNIGLGYSMFEMFDEAVTHFEKSKSILEEIAANLEKKGDDVSTKEAKEIRNVFPDLNEKIQDMIDSKKEKRKEVENVLNSMSASVSKANGSLPVESSSESDKPASNITHLIKRKRKIDEVTSDLPSKSIEEPKRKVKALDKEALEEERSEIISEKKTPIEKKKKTPIN